MITLAIFAGAAIVAVAFWTYWLMLKVIRPNDAGTTQLQQLNDRMLRMLESADLRHGESMDRLFSASAGIQSLGSQLIQRSLATSRGSHGPPAPHEPIRTPRVVHDDDDGDDVTERMREKAEADFARREDLQEAGAIGVPASDI